MAAIYELQQSLSTLAGYPNAPWIEAQQAANIWAGLPASGPGTLDLLAALNCRYYSTGTWPLPGPNMPVLELNAVCNKLAGTTGKEAQDALSGLAGGGHS